MEDKPELAVNWKVSPVHRRRQTSFITAPKTDAETKHGVQ